MINVNQGIKLYSIWPDPTENRKPDLPHSARSSVPPLVNESESKYRVNGSGYVFDVSQWSHRNIKAFEELLMVHCQRK